MSSTAKLKAANRRFRQSLAFGTRIRVRTSPKTTEYDTDKKDKSQRKSTRSIGRFKRE